MTDNSEMKHVTVRVPVDLLEQAEQKNTFDTRSELFREMLRMYVSNGQSPRNAKLAMLKTRQEILKDHIDTLEAQAKEFRRQYEENEQLKEEVKENMVTGEEAAIRWLKTFDGPRDLPPLESDNPAIEVAATNNGMKPDQFVKAVNDVLDSETEVWA